MRIHSKYIFIVGALLPMFLFLFPMWQIILEAPQYVEPLRLFIWINKITGGHESTLQKINILNHYVGMAKIKPEMFWELQVFPWIVAGMSVMGVVFGFINNQKLFLLWVMLWIILGIAGIYDFYLWEYQYGHNLDPTAPIKIPGQNYQPPLIGGKSILNFDAYSFPALGALFLGLGVLLGTASYWLKRKFGI